MKINEIKRVRKKFMYGKIELRIVERNEPYLNAERPILVTRVLAPNGGSIPIQIARKETLKSIQAKSISFLDGMEKRGANNTEELTKDIGL